MRRNPRTKYPGVYGIRHKASGQMYIGGSVDTTGRFTHHRFMLRRGRHKCRPLQDAWTKWGEAEFEFIILERCSATDVAAREQFWHEAVPESFNVVKGVTAIGRVMSDDFRANATEAAKRRWARPEYRMKREAFLAVRQGGRFVALEHKS